MSPGQLAWVVDELRRLVVERQESELWDQARRDPAYAAEAEDLERAYAPADRETWPTEPA